MSLGGEDGKQDMGHELRNLSVALLQEDGFVSHPEQFSVHLWNEPVVAGIINVN